MDDLESELKRLIVSALMLEDLAPEDIGSDEALFGDAGLGLDSIDALELGVAIRKTYGIKIETVSDEVRAHFATVRALAAFIRSNGGNAP
ncbi:acyl carrier protein [Paramagnetospirillum kuznetsovii]|uniref:Acyl carrier protein n=1 Tax=Paramagnetospirillum kuznetsovii TaxID=2053833 RepID=A0A364NUS8_9PROT|nr:phosphopantetheine-binding protein [Paramagnetospirillum kuznetsovii]RAU20812.1 acyl carrier protein [Paramagnetospirillum kuznetsovii]